MNNSTKNWLGIVLVFWPLVRVIAHGFGLDLPDLGGLTDVAHMASTTAGAALMATSGPISKAGK